MKTLYNGRRDPLVRRKIWQRFADYYYIFRGTP